MERRLHSRTEVITMVKARLGEPALPENKRSAQEVETGQAPAPRAGEEIAPEIRAVIAAAVVALLGRNARVLSARPTRAAVSPWTQQGRLIVQSSHNLRERR